MQGRIDVLASDISVVGQSDFTSDSAVNDVAVNNVAANGLPFYNAEGDSYFDLGDNILIRKIWAVVNWGFGQGGYNSNRPHNIGLGFWNGAAIEIMPPFSSGARSINIPTLCAPLDFGDGIIVIMPVVGTRRQIRLTNLDLRISQINLPTALNATRIPVQYFVEVLHTNTMKVAP